MISNNKFGQVFLQKEDSGSKILKRLATARVSSMDMKWYDNNGQIHELFSSHTGKSVSLQFTFSVKNKNEKVCSQLMTLLLPDKLGYFAGPNTELLENGPRVMTELGFRSGYAQEDLQKQLINVEAAAFVALCGAGKLADDLLIHTVMLELFIWDDFLDKECPEELKRYLQLSEVIDCLVDIIRERKISYNGMGQASIDIIRKHKSYFELVRQEAVRAAKKWDSSLDPFLEEMEKYMLSCKLEACVEWNAKKNSGSELFNRVQEANRVYTVGILAVMEAFALADGIYLRDSIRDSFVFQSFKRLVVEHIAKVNDFMSFQREYANGEVSNYLYLLHVEQGLSMEESLQRTTDELNSVVAAVVEAGEFLMGLFPEEEQLARFIKLGKRE